MTKKILILNNIGSPDSPSPEDVGHYLQRFLMDKEVIPLPWPLRWFLVNVLIVPKRKQASAEKYHKIWTEEGSPLTVWTEKLRQKWSSQAGPEWVIETGMKFGSPTLEELFRRYQQEQKNHPEQTYEFVLFPMYPQYAEATTGSAHRKAQRWMRELGLRGNLKSVAPFYDQNSFLSVSVEKIRKTLSPQDYVLFSYHGLPEQQIKKKSGCLATANCCLQPEACAKGCYRAQCFKTTELMVQRLGLADHQYSSSFQSRLGRAKWIGPSTDDEMKRLVANGVKSLKVVCPSFVSDCLETLEEIGIGLREDFFKEGGSSFELIPCVNDDWDFPKEELKILDLPL